jgi:hypothetical protein
MGDTSGVSHNLGDHRCQFLGKDNGMCSSRATTYAKIPCNGGEYLVYICDIEPR